MLLMATVAMYIHTHVNENLTAGNIEIVGTDITEEHHVVFMVHLECWYTHVIIDAHLMRSLKLKTLYVLYSHKVINLQIATLIGDEIFARINL